MARIRSVHPSLFTDEAWVSCSPLARLLYIGLWTDADDQGLFEWKPLQIKMRLLPGDSADVPALLAELIGADLISGLESGGKKLGAIRYFRKFQRPKKPNATFVLPAEWVNYVGLSGDDGEPEGDEPPPVGNQFPPSGENSPQREDGGGVKEERSETNVSSLSQRASPKAKSPIAEGFPGQPEVAEAAEMVAEAGVVLDAADHAKRFRGHALTNDRRVADWGAAWRSWVEIEIGKAPAAAAPPAPAEPYVWPGPADIWGLAVSRMGPDWAAGYVGRCAWRDGALVCPSPTIAKGIRGEIGRDLDGLGYRLLEGQAA